jgi:LacI family transcriptional regulator
MSTPPTQSTTPSTPPTIYELAALAGTTATTVSRVMNRRDGVGAELRDRVLRIAREHGYEPSFHARNLAARRSFSLGVVFPLRASELVENPVYPELLGGIGDAFAEAGYVLSLLTATDGASAEQVRSLVRERRVDGLLFPAARCGDELVDWAVDEGVPTVLVGHRDERPDLCWVDCAGDAAVEILTGRLLVAGRRRLVFLNGPMEYSSVRLRLDGFRRAVADASAEAREASAEFTSESGYEAMRTILAEGGEHPDAVVCVNDLVAAGALRALSEVGLSVPGDVAVTGFDDRFLAQWLSPALTTVKMPLTAMGRLGADMLVRLANRETVRERHVVLEAAIVERSSTPAPHPAP